MFRKLDLVEARHQSLTDRLADPSVATNPAELRKLSQERAQLDPVVLTYREYKTSAAELAQNRELLEDSDPDMRAMAKDEVTRLEALLAELERKLMIQLLPKDPNDERNIILEVRAGTGGDEASLFAGELFRLYSRYAETRRWKVELMSASAGGAGGFKEVIAMISGELVYSQLKWESGVHRVQRVPATEAQGRIHTSAVTVAVLPEAEEVEVAINESKDLRIDVYRSSGPGGQSVNTTDSAVRITHLPSGLVVACQDEKSQHKNKAKALKILRARLYEQAQQEQAAAIAAERKTMVKSGDRSDKIRTYNFPQDRLTDHRIGLTVHNLDKIMQGEIDHVVEALRAHHQAEAMKASTGDGDGAV